MKPETTPMPEVELQITKYRSLSHFFDSAFSEYFEKIYRASSDLDSREKSDLATQLIDKFAEIATHVDRLNLFSTNEHISEVKTSEIKFITVTYILGELYSNVMDMDKRLEALQNAIINFKTFTNTAKAYEIVHQDDKNAIEKPTVTLERMDKIERTKRIAALDAKISALFNRLKRLSSSNDDDEDSTLIDEEMHRSLMITFIERSVANSINEVRMIEQELPFLEQMAKQRMETPAEQERRLAVEEAHRRADAAKKPFMLRINDPVELRQLYHDRVLQPFITMPTMSIEEIGLKEMELETEILTQKEKVEVDNQVYQGIVSPWYENEEMQEDEEGEVRDQEMRGRARVIRHNQDEEDEKRRAAYDALDDEYGAREDKDYEEREWDDWKDENPRGWGNKMVNRG